METVTGSAENAVAPIANEVLQDYPEPSFGKARRLAGFVATPPVEWSHPAGIPLPSGGRRHSWTKPAAAAAGGSGTSSSVPPSLSRHQSVAGNILVVTSTQQTEKTKKKSAYLLQRKLEHMSNGYTVRVGYPLVVEEEKEDKQSEDDEMDVDSGDEQRIWEVQPNAPLVAIHMHPMSCLPSTKIDPAAATPLANATHYDPRAEWFVWQQQQQANEHESTSVLLQSFQGGLEDKTASETAGSLSTQQKSCYYSIAPLHTSTVWDDLCQRKQPYTEREAQGIFLQIIKCLEHLQQLELCHRNITLHNLMLIDDDDGGNDADGDTTMGTTSQSGETENTGDNKTTKDARLCLARHGYALRVGPPNSSSIGNAAAPKLLLPIPPPPTAQPLYVAPEWMTQPPPSGQNDNNTSDSTTGTTLVDPYAVDLWSATICLLVLLVGVPNIASTLYAAPLPEDPRFVPVTQHVEAYFHNRLNLPWSRPLLDLLTRLLHPDPAHRMTLAQVQQHPWVLGQVEEDETKKPPTAMATTATDSTSMTSNGTKRRRSENQEPTRDNTNSS